MTTHSITALVLEAFRVNGLVLAAGDDLVADLGLTSARWQVLGSIALSDTPLPVAGIARTMGLTRQAVQRLANEMARDGLIHFASNPHHQRAKLVLLTHKGKAAYEAAMRRQVPWAENLAAGLSAEQIEAAAFTLRSVRQRLESATQGETPDA